MWWLTVRTASSVVADLSCAPIDSSNSSTIKGVVSPSVRKMRTAWVERMVWKLAVVKYVVGA